MIHGVHRKCEKSDDWSAEGVFVNPEGDSGWMSKLD